MHKYQIFLDPSYNNWGVLGITKLSDPYLQENVILKKCLDAALYDFIGLTLNFEKQNFIILS